MCHGDYERIKVQIIIIIIIKQDKKCFNFAALILIILL